MSLSTYYLKYGRHVARLHRRRRAYAPTSNTAALDNHEKISSWVSLFLYGYGAPLGGPLGRWSSAITKAEIILKDVRAHCYCASLVRTLFIGHARVTSFSSGGTESKTQQNIELMTFALTWCVNIFVGRSVTPTFLSADRFLF